MAPFPKTADIYTPQVVEHVSSVIEKANQTGCRVEAWDTIRQILVDAGIAWQAQVPPQHVGVHPENRSRLGVGGSEAHMHGHKIMQAGFSWTKCADVVAVECPPAPHDAEAKSSNDSYVQFSGGLIPPLQQLKLLSLGGGHTNTFLRAVQAGTRSAVPSLCDNYGVLSKDMLTVNRPALRGRRSTRASAGLWCIGRHPLCGRSSSSWCKLP